MTDKQDQLSARSDALKRRGHILDSATVYLSGPMDFVASREEERLNGWRTRITQFMREFGTTVYDPWNKPDVSGMTHYGKEDEFTANRRDDWTYADDKNGARMRDQLCEEFWPTLHIDLRMTDLADFLIAYCPTNIYSVGTVHEIATARLQHKPVLLVTPTLQMSTICEMEKYLAELDDDGKGTAIFNRLKNEVVMRPNEQSIPSLWYMAMLGSEDYFFDGFGFAKYAKEFDWAHYPPLDDREKLHPPRRPLLPYLERLNKEIPRHYDASKGAEIENPEWLIFVDEDVQE